MAPPSRSAFTTLYIDRNSPQKKGGMLLSSSSPQTLSYEENSQLAVSLLVTVLNEENRALISLEASSRSEIYLRSNPASASLVHSTYALRETGKPRSLAVSIKTT